MNARHSLLEGFSVAVDLARGRQVHHLTSQECVFRCLDLAAGASHCDNYQNTRCVCVNLDFEQSAMKCFRERCSTSEMYSGVGVVASLCGLSPAPIPVVSLVPRQAPPPDPNFTSGFPSFTSLRPTPTFPFPFSAPFPFPTSPVSSSNPIPPATSVPNTPEALSKKSNIGPIVGGIVGGIIVLALIVVAIFWMRRRRRSQPDTDLDIFDPGPPAAASHNIPQKKGGGEKSMMAMQQLPRGGQQHLTAPSSSDPPSSGARATSASDTSQVPSSVQPPSSNDTGISQVPTAVLYHELRQRMRVEQEESESVFSGPPEYMTSA